MKLLHSNVKSIFQPDTVVIVVPDESKSHAKRRGASKGPDNLRIASNTFDFFERENKIIPICPIKGTLEKKKILDFGNISREDLYGLVFDIVSAKKLPITIGGDHSIATIILQAIYKRI